MEIALLVGMPLILALVPGALKRRGSIAAAHACGYAVSCVAAAVLFYRCAWLGQKVVALKAFFFFDALSSFFMFTVSLVAFCVALYSGGFIKKELEAGRIGSKELRSYYLLVDLFVFAMLMVLSVNNAGFMWISIEMTTLISAFLVGFHRTKESVEAAWKYIIICTVGIIIALIGTILFYYALSDPGNPGTLSWTEVLSRGGEGVDSAIIKAAFVFILVGYGTKAGLAPMHTWLPDAHSQAVSPASALLSGVLLKTALYAIIRYAMALNAVLGQSFFSGTLFIFFGIACLAVAGGFVFVQKDLKRLLAYSSIEHIGVMCVGLGIGGPMGFGGAMLHVFNHAVNKSLMFLAAGRIVSHYGTHSMRRMRGVLESMPFSGGMFLLGAFALSGFPPFSIFISECIVLAAAFQKKAYWAAGLTLVFLAMVFAGMAFHFSRMLAGRKPEGVGVSEEPPEVCFSLAILLALTLCAGLAVPLLLSSGFAGKLRIAFGG